MNIDQLLLQSLQLLGLGMGSVFIILSLLIVIINVIAKLVPELPPEVRKLRLMFMSVNAFHGVAEVASLAHTPLGDLSHFNNDQLLDHLVDYLIGGLKAPSLASQ